MAVYWCDNGDYFGGGCHVLCENCYKELIEVFDMLTAAAGQMAAGNDCFNWKELYRQGQAVLQKERKFNEQA